MLNYRGIITHNNFDFSSTMLKHSLFVGLFYFREQFVQKSAEMDLRDKNFRHKLSLRFVLLFELRYSKSGRQIWADRTFRIFFADFSFFDLCNCRTIFMSINWFKLDTVIDWVISKAAKLVLWVIFGSFSVLVRTFNKQSILDRFFCFWREHRIIVP